VRPPRWLPWLILGAVLAPVIFRTQADPDLWGHVRFGLDLLASRALTSTDPYSFTQDIPWVNHEWSSELMMGTTYQIAGPAGLALLKGILVLLTFLVVLSAYRDASPPLLASAFLVLAAGTGRVTLTLRPQLWSLLAMAILCRWLLAGARRWWLIAFPVLFLFWVNVHGGWIVGAGVLAIWIAINLWTDRSSRKLLSGVGLLSTLSTLINPYGWRMWEFLGETVRVSRSISEWQPLFTTPVVAWIPWFVVGFAVVWSLFGPKRPSLDRLAIAIVLAVASFRVERLSAFYVVATLVLFSSVASSRWPAEVRTFDPISRRAASVLSAMLFIACLASAAITVKAASCIPIVGDWIPDRIAGRALVDARINGRMVTWFDWGEYAIWHLSPSVRVSLDGRRETMYSDVVLRAHDEMDAGTPEGLAYLQRLDPDYVWLPARLTKVSAWLADHGYRLDVQTPRSFVAVRAGLPVVKISDAPLASCFPGP
jgi:hypothetical protein